MSSCSRHKQHNQLPGRQHCSAAATGTCSAGFARSHRHPELPQLSGAHGQLRRPVVPCTAGNCSAAGCSCNACSCVPPHLQTHPDCSGTCLRPCYVCRLPPHLHPVQVCQLHRSVLVPVQHLKHCAHNVEGLGQHLNQVIMEAAIIRKYSTCTSQSVFVEHLRFARLSGNQLRGWGDHGSLCSAGGPTYVHSKALQQTGSTHGQTQHAGDLSADVAW